MNFCLVFLFECSIIVWVGNETFAHWMQLPGSLWAGVCDYDQFWFAGCPVCGSYAKFFVLLCNFEENQLFCAPILYRYIIIKV